MARPTSALIVDDEAHARKYVQLLLKELGVTTFWEAENADEAFSLFDTHQPALVMLDVNLPAMSGLEILTELIQRQPDIPVIMVSAESAMKTVLEALRLGATGYVLKLASKSDALKTLRETFDSLEVDEAEPEDEASGAT